MAGKIKIQAEDNEEVSEDPKLVEKVDQMMDPKKATENQGSENDPNEAIVDSETSDESTPELDIFADTPSAPLLEKPHAKKNRAKKTTVKVSTDEPVIEDQSLSEDEEKDDHPEEAVLERPDRPDNYDDPQTTQAIDDIVSHESDMILALNDQKLSRAKKAATPVNREHHHRIFWSIIALLSLIAIAVAVYIVDPSIYTPLSKVHWSSIRKHL